MSVDYRVTVGVNVNDAALTKLENRLNSLVAKGYTVNLGTSTGALSKQLGGVLGTATSKSAKDLIKTTTAASTAFWKPPTSFTKDLGKAAKGINAAMYTPPSYFTSLMNQAKGATPNAQWAKAIRTNFAANSTANTHRITGTPSGTTSASSARHDRKIESAKKKYTGAIQSATKQQVAENKVQRNNAASRNRYYQKSAGFHQDAIDNQRKVAAAEQKAAKAAIAAEQKAARAATNQAKRQQASRASSQKPYGSGGKYTAPSYGTPATTGEIGLSTSAASARSKAAINSAKSTANSYGTQQKYHTQSYKRVAQILATEKQIQQAQKRLVDLTSKRTKNMRGMYTGLTGSQADIDKQLSQQIAQEKRTIDKYRQKSNQLQQTYWGTFSDAQKGLINNTITGSQTSTSKRSQMEFKALQSVMRDIDKITRQASKVTDKTGPEMKRLMSDLDSALTKRAGIWNSLQGNLSGSQLNTFTQQIMDSDSKISRLLGHQQQLAKNKNLKITASVNTKDAINKLDVLEKRLLKIDQSRRTTGATSALQGLRTAESDLRGASTHYAKYGTDDYKGKTLSYYQQAFNSAHKLASNEIAMNERLEKSILANRKLMHDKSIFSGQMYDWLTKNSKAAATYSGHIDQIKSSLKNVNSTAQLNTLKTDFAGVKREAEAAGLATMKFSDRLKMQGQRLASYYMMSFGMMQGMFLVADAFRNVIEVDTAMTELRRVTDLTSGQYEKMYDSMAASAREYGATLKDTISSTADWVKQGFDAETALGLAEVSSMYQHIGDIDKAEANENLITAYNGYKEELKNLYNGDDVAAVSYAGDVYNEIGNNFAITSGQIGDGMTRAASALNFAGNTFQEAVGMITAVTEVTQDPEKAGSAMKILSLRLRGMKGELEEVESGASEGVESVSKMQTQILNMTGGKVNIFKDNGEFESTYDIMKGIADVWDELSDVDQANLLETIAGKNRANDVAALIDNFARAEEAMNSALDAEGSAAREHEKYLDSIQGRITTLQATWESFSNSVIDTGAFKLVVSALNGLLDILTSVVNEFGMLPIIAGSLMASFSSHSKMFNAVKNDNGTVTFSSIFSKSEADKKKSNAFKNSISQIKNDRKALKAYAKEYAKTGNMVAAQDKYLSTYKDGVGRKHTVSQSARNFASEYIKQDSANNQKQLNQMLNSFEKQERTSIAKQQPSRFFSDDFTKNLQSERKALAAYAKEYAKTGDMVAAQEKHLKNVSQNAFDFAQRNIDRTTALNKNGEMGKMLQSFTKQEKSAEVSAMAYDKSWQSKIKMIKEFNRLQTMDANNTRIMQEQRAIMRGMIEDGRKQGLKKETIRNQEAYVKAQKEFNEARRQGINNAKEFAKETAKGDAALAKTMAQANGSNANIAGYAVNKGMQGIKNIGLQFTSMMGNMAMGMAAGAAIYAAIAAFDAMVDSSEEVAERAGDATNEYETQKKTIQETNSLLTESGNRYAELSKGVDRNGKNISLSSSEYEEYLSLSNQIAQTMPNLVQGYDEQGNAILKCKGNVEQLTEAYNELIETSNNALIAEDEDIFKDFGNQFLNLENKFDKTAEGIEQKGYDALEKLMNSEDMDSLLKSYNEEQNTMLVDDASLTTRIGKATQSTTKELSDTLRANGVEKEDGESYEEHVKRAITEERQAVNSIMTSHEALMKDAASEMQNIVEAYFSNAFLGDNYKNISEESQEMLNNMIPNLSYDFFAEFTDEAGNFDSTAFYAELDNILYMFDSFGKDTEEAKTLGLFIDFQTKYNNGDVTVGEYLKEIEKVESFISQFDEQTQEALRITLGLDIDTTETDRDALVKKLTNETSGLSKKVATTFANSLNVTELQTAFDLISDGTIDKSMLEEYSEVLSEAESLAQSVGRDLSSTKFGNVDLDEDRGFIQWNEQNLEKYKSQIMSWQEAGVDWNSVKKDLEGSVSTVGGRSRSIEGIEIAYTPYLETEDGLELLSKGTVDKYLNKLFEKAKEDDGKVDAAELLSFDMTGLEVDGKRISGLLASVGANAREIGELMHYIGPDGAIEATEAMRELRREVEVLTALDYEIDITAESEQIDKVNTALSETMSATGVAVESVDVLTSRYAGLEVAGRSLNDLFEATSVGLRMNTEVFSEFEQALSSQKLNETTNQLFTLENELARVEAVIADVNATASDRSAAIARRNEVIEHMNLLGQQAAMYEGLTSKYAAWQNAESAGQNRDMYDEIISAHDTVKDELSRGWVDDGTVKYMELLTGRSDLAGKSIQQMRSIFKGLDNDINSAGYSINDFFTVDSEGNSTSEGWFNFLDTINAEKGKVGDSVTIDKNGNYTFDFDVAGGDEAIAEALGISEELVHIMLQAGKDAGFEVNFEGQYEHFSKIVSSAEEALARLNELHEGANFDFDFDTSDAEILAEDLAESTKLLEQYRGKDGKIDETIEGATEALEVASTLQTAWDRLSDPAYMSVDASTVEADLQEPLEKLQEYDRLLAEQHQHELAGTTGSKAYKENQAAMKETYEYFKKIRDEGGQLAKDFEIKGLSDEELQQKLDNQELSIPTELDIAANIDDSVNKLLDVAMFEAGLKEPIEIPWMLEEKDDVKLGGLDLTKYGEEAMDVYNDFILPNKELLNTFSDAQRSVAVDFYVNNPEVIEAFDNKKERNIALKFVSNNEELLNGLTKEQQDRVINFRVKNAETIDKIKNVSSRDIVYNFVAKKGNLDWLNEFKDGKKNIIIKFMSNNDDVLNQYEDGEKKVILDIVADSKVARQSINELSETNQKIVFDCMVSNEELFNSLTAEQWPIVVDFIANNPNFLEKYTDPVTQEIVLEYVSENGEKAWKNLGKDGQQKYIKEQRAVKVEAGEIDTSDVDKKTDEKVKKSSGKKNTTKKTDVEVKADKVDKSDVDKKTDEAVEKSGKKKKTTKKADIDVKAGKVDKSDVDKKTDEAVKGSGKTSKTTKTTDIDFKAGKVDKSDVDNKTKDAVEDESAETEAVSKTVELELQIDEANELLQNLENVDKDIVINVDINGLDKVKDLTKSIKLATSIDGNVEGLAKFAKAAKNLDGVSNNIVSTVTADVYGNLEDNINLDNLPKFINSAKSLDGVSSSFVTVGANLDSNLNENVGDIGNLVSFAEGAKALQGIPSSTVAIKANLDASGIGDGWFGSGNSTLDNLKDFAEGARALQGVPSSDVSVTATLATSGIGDGMFSGGNSVLDNLSKFAEGANLLRGIGDITANVTAVLATSGIGDGIFGGNSVLDNLASFAEGASLLNGVGDVSSTVTAVLASSGIGDGWLSGDNSVLNNLSSFADGANAIKDVGEVKASVQATLSSSGIADGWLSGDNSVLNNLASFAEGANAIKDVGEVRASVTAVLASSGIADGWISGDNSTLDNLGKFADGANAIKNVGEVKASVQATLAASGISDGWLSGDNSALNNLGQFAEGAEKIKGIGNDVSATVTATLEADGISDGWIFENSALNNLGKFADGAAKLQNVDDVDVSVEPTLNVDFETSDIDNLTSFANSAVKLQDIDDVEINVNANLEGEINSNVVENLESFADGAAKLQGVGDAESNITVSLDAEGLDGDTFGYGSNSAVNNLSKFAEGASKIKGVGDAKASVTAVLAASGISDGWLSGDNSALNNLGKFAEGAEKLKNVGEISAKVTATLDADGISDGWIFDNSALNNLGKFADGAEKVKGIGNDVSAKLKVSLEADGISDGWIFENSALNNLGKFATNAQKLQGVEDKTVKIDATLEGNIGDSESSMNNLPAFASAASTLQGVSDKTVTITANVEGTMTKGNVGTLSQFGAVVSSLPPSATVNVTANVDTQKITSAMTTLQALSNSGVMHNYSANVSVTSNINTSAVDGYTPASKDSTVNFGVDSSKVDAWNAPAKTGTVTYIPKVGALTDAQKNKTGTITYKAKVSEVSGTANFRGTSNSVNYAHSKGSAFAMGTSGRAFARGNWGINGSGVALGGELGQELVVRDGRFFTVGDTGAEFFQYKKNDIVFNAAQTESLFRYGGIKGAKPRGKMLAGGSAFANGSIPSSGRAFPWNDGSDGGGGGRPSYGDSNSKNSGSNSNSNSNGNGNGDDDKTKKKTKNDFKEVFDWIEIAIDRIERLIERLGKTADSVYKTWEQRNKALTQSISQTRKEIDLQWQGYNRYLKQAKGVGLSNKWMKKVRQAVDDGYTIDISTITDENLADKIQRYQEWYEKALDCKDAIDELGESLSELYSQKFDLVVTKYESQLTRLEHKTSMIEEYISQSEARGQVVNENYYKALINNNNTQMKRLEAQKKDMKSALDAAVNSGTIAMYSEEWYRMVEEINGVTLAMEELETSNYEYQQSIREIQWEKFDLLQDKISDITKETEFLIDLMSNKQLYNKDTGQLTSEGIATMGLHAENYSVYMKQASMYQSEIDKINKQIANDPTNQDIIDRKRELVEAQQDSISAAESEKNAIRDMVEEGINLELDALQERIDKYNEALESQKDLYDYQKKVKEQTKEIAALEKQMAAYAGDDSEEAKQKVQQLKVELEEAKADLEETEYDKYISDQGELLDDMYEKYEEILNERLDDVDLLMEDMISEVNNNTSIISQAISDAASSVGYQISQANQTAWKNGNNDVESSTDKAISGVESEHKKSVNTPGGTSVPDAGYSPEASGTKQGNNKINVGDKVTLKSGVGYYSGYGAKAKRKGTTKKKNTLYVTAARDPKKNAYPYRLSWDAARASGDLGWVKLNGKNGKKNFTGYASGVEELLKDETAWTQESGTEFIMRRSDGAILTPLAKGDGVLNAQASANLWNMSNNPADFIRDNLGLDNVDAPINGNSQNTIINNLDGVTFSLPGVKNYDEFVHAMTKDKNVERYVKSITTDLIAGKSKLAKGKSIR